MAVCEVKSHLVQKLLPGHTDRPTYRNDCSPWTTKMVGNEASLNDIERQTSKSSIVGQLINDHRLLTTST